LLEKKKKRRSRRRIRRKGKKKKIVVYRMFPITGEPENRKWGGGSGGGWAKVWRRCRLKVGKDVTGPNVKK
jgi:hypothetical protein